MEWQGGNGIISSSPLVSQFYPNIQLTVSADAGNTWSVPIRASRTPIDFNNLGASQSFNGNVAVTEDGYVGVVYYDYRNFTACEPATSVPTDVWLDIYEELSDPTGGPYGNGLKFVQEVRLTPTSFNAANAISFPAPEVPGIFENLLGTDAGIAANGNDFDITLLQTGPTPLPSNVVTTQSLAC